MDGNQHEEIRRDSRIASDCYVEIVKDSISNRNQVVTTEQYKKAVLDYSWSKEMYRSYFVFDESFDKHVTETGTVKGFDGSCAMD